MLTKYNDLPENLDDALDKHLAVEERNDPVLEEHDDTSSSSDSDFRVPSLDSSDEEEEEWVDDATAKHHDEFLDEVAREQMDRAHDEYLRNREAVMNAASVLLAPVVVDVNKSLSAGDQPAVVDLCQPDQKKKASRRSASLPIPRIAPPTKTARKNLPLQLIRRSIAKITIRFHLLL